MPLYRVYGTKYYKFYTDVQAADEYEAAQIANSRSSHDWSGIEDDDVIEATDVTLINDSSEQLQFNMAEG